MSASVDADVRFVAIARAHRDQLRARLDILDTMIAVYEATAIPVPAVAPAPKAVETPKAVVAPVAPAVSAPPPAKAQEPSPEPQRPTGQRIQKTPERVKLLREMYHREPRPKHQDMVDALNKLPGEPVPVTNISAFIIQWGAKEPPPARPAPSTPPAARAAVTSLVAAHSYPDVVTMAHAIRWGAERGIPGPKLDLVQINARRRHLGLAQFMIEG